MKLHWIVWVFVGMAVGGGIAVIFFLWLVRPTLSPSINKPAAQPAATASIDPGPKMVEIELVEGQKTQRFQTRAATLGEALNEQTIQVSPEDLLIPPADTGLTAPLRVELRRAVPLQIVTQAGTFSIRAAGQTVGAALARAGFAPQNMDYSIPPLESALPENGTIQLVRVSEQVEFDQTLLPYKTEYRPNSKLDLETKEDMQAGQQGVDAGGIRRRIEDGKTVAEEKQPQWRAKDPQTHVVGYGTQAVKKVLDVPGGKIEYWMALNMYATSYSPCRLGKPNYCHYTTGTGAKLQRGIVAVTRADFSVFGESQVYIPGYGSAVVADIGGGIPGKRWIDLGYGEDDYKAWSSNVTVYFLWPPPAGYLSATP